MQDKHQEGGDLDQVLALKGEIESLKEDGSAGAGDLAKFPALLDARGTFIHASLEISNSAGTRRLELLRAYGKKLTGAKDRLTKENKIDDAVAVDRERTRGSPPSSSCCRTPVRRETSTL